MKALVLLVTRDSGAKFLHRFSLCTTSNWDWELRYFRFSISHTGKIFIKYVTVEPHLRSQPVLGSGWERIGALQTHTTGTMLVAQCL
jgi:hypothetical protein